jgi:hypothetical protein
VLQAKSSKTAWIVSPRSCQRLNSRNSTARLLVLASVPVKVHRRQATIDRATRTLRRIDHSAKSEQPVSHLPIFFADHRTAGTYQYL